MKKQFAISILCAAAFVAAGAWAQQAKAPQKKPTVEQLPPAVAKVVKLHKPGATINKMTIEKGGGVNLYDIEFTGQSGEIEVAEDGTVIDVSTIVQMKDLPPPAAAAIQKVVADAGAGAHIMRLEKAEVHSEVGEGPQGKIVKLLKVKYLYEAELMRGSGQTGEVTVDATGKIVEGPKWDK